MSMTSERVGKHEALTVQVRTQTDGSGFEKHVPTWATDTAVGASGTVTAILLDAGAQEIERAQALGEVATKTVVALYPVGLTAQKHRFVSGSTNYRVIEVNESMRRARYVCASDTS